jgi:ribonuclease BN (tRNA processing enzyme)
MKLTVIGYWGAYPEVNEATSGYLLEHNEKKVLIDCGSGVLSKLQDYIKLEELDAVVISHYHADHFADLYCLQYATIISRHLETRVKPLKIFGLGNDQKFETLEYGSSCIAYPLNSGDTLEIEGLKFTFLDTEHPIPCVAMRIEANGRVLSYSGDSSWSENLIKIARSSNVFLCECSLYSSGNAKVAGHLTGEEVGKIASKAGVNQLILTHLPHFGDRKELIVEAQKHYNGKITLAKGGLAIEI